MLTANPLVKRNTRTQMRRTKELCGLRPGSSFRLQKKHLGNICSIASFFTVCYM